VEKDEEGLNAFLKFCGEKKYMLGAERDYKNDELDSIFCFELSQEYIDYLKEILKP
jgi:hypothetical protein